MGNHYKKLFLASTITLMMGVASPAAAFQDSPNTLGGSFDTTFNEAPTLSDGELDEMRGGFITSNGMLIDFIFSTNTLVDGELINQVVLNSADPTSSLNSSLHKIVQIGDGNSAFSEAVDVASLPNVLTIVQNNLSDLTIQQVNLLDLSVKNFDNYIQQNVAPEMAFQSTFRLSP